MASLIQTPLALSLSKGALSALALIAVSGCSAQAPSGEAGADADDRIACAVAGAAEFARACQVERREVDGAAILVVRHPDGGFRRFILHDDGGFETADGAERVERWIDEDRDDVTEYSVGADRYRFPARVFNNGAR
jgi:hypothetical protein